jgi:recombination protein RecA
MAKRKSAAAIDVDDDFFQEFAEETDGAILDAIDSVKYFVDTGSLAINYICSGKFIGGGVPGGKLTEIYGPNSSSKSLIGTNILFGCQRKKGIPILEDCENSANKEFIRTASHCDLKRIVRHTPQTLEEVFVKMYKSIEFVRSKKGKDVQIAIVYDSIGVSPSARELKEVALPEKYTQEQFKKMVGGKEQPGERAKICSREFRKLNTVMEKNDATVIILNQTRDKIGVMYGNPKTTAGGGNALPFYASCRLETSTMKKIERKITAKKKKILGINIRVKNVKNKTHRPFVESENIRLLFDYGIDPVSGLLSCLLDAERIEIKGAGNFAVKEPWAGGSEVKFKASLERNDVPMEILFKCPGLIDAESEEEVREYLAPYQAAIDFQVGGDIVETDVLGEDEDEMIDDELSSSEESESEE